MKRKCVLFVIFGYIVTCSSVAFAETIIKSDTKTVVKLKEGAFKITLPESYTPGVGKEADTGMLFIKSKKENLAKPYPFFGVEITPISREDLKKDESRALEAIKRSGSPWPFEDSEIFGQPCLIQTCMLKGDLRLRIISFVKNGKLYMITFSCKKENFDKEWPIVEQSIKSIEFING